MLFVSLSVRKEADVGVGNDLQIFKGNKPQKEARGQNRNADCVAAGQDNSGDDDMKEIGQVKRILDPARKMEKKGKNDEIDRNLRGQEPVGTGCFGNRNTSGIKFSRGRSGVRIEPTKTATAAARTAIHRI